MISITANYVVTWEKLPDDFLLPDEPLDNINQPSLAAALTESLEIAGRLPENALTMTNYGICATVNGKIVVKAPDWGYVIATRVPREEVKRSYTPQLQGEIPVILMEFLSDTEGGEYSIKPTYPPGKWFFMSGSYRCRTTLSLSRRQERSLVYRLDDSGQYRLQAPDGNNRYWIAQINLFVGLWQGTRENRTGYWLRWWDEQGELLLWGAEMVEQERQAKEAAVVRAEQLAAKLRDLGINPGTL